MASVFAMPVAPRTAPQHAAPSGGRAAAQRPGAGVELDDLAPDLSSADLRFLFDRYGELAMAEVRGTRGFLWYDDERDAAWVVAKLQGACGRHVAEASRAC